MQKAETTTTPPENNPEGNKDSSKDQANTNPEFDAAKLSVSVHLVKDTAEGPYRSKAFTSFLAMKSPSTYLVIKRDRSIKVTKDGKEIFLSKLLNRDLQYLNSAIYIAHLDCFLILIQRGLYRKDINEENFYFWMNLPSLPQLHLSGRVLRYSPRSRRLVCFLLWESLTVINPGSKKIELDLKHEALGVVDFTLFGKDKSKVAAINFIGQLFLFIMSYSRKKLLASNEVRLQLNLGEKEKVKALATCDKTDQNGDEYIMVQTGRGRPHQELWCTRLVEIPFLG